jgi:hypothetical protein
MGDWRGCNWLWVGNVAVGRSVEGMYVATGGRVGVGGFGWAG